MKKAFTVIKHVLLLLHYVFLLILQENNYQYDHNDDNMRLRSSQIIKLKPHKLYFTCLPCIAKKLKKRLC